MDIGRMCLAYFSIAVLVSSIFASTIVHADVLPPAKQIKLGISADNVFCKEGFVKLIKTTTKNPTCIRDTSVESLVARGWANPVDIKLIEESHASGNELVSIKKLSVIPLDKLGKPTIKNAISYDYIFEVCAGSNPILIPEITVKSDSEVNKITLAEDVPTNTCVTSVSQIRAGNPDTIVASLVDKDRINDTIIDMQNNLKDLSAQLLDAKGELAKIDTSKNKTSDYSQQVSDITTKITELRSAINNARNDLYNYFFAMYVPSNKVSTVTPLNYSGQPLEGESVKILAASKGLVGDTTYNVVFEVCAGKDAIRVPQISLSSDTEEKPIKLPDKISPNTCQKTGAKIEAVNPDSISISPAKNAEIQRKSMKLDQLIVDLSAEIASQKKTLNDLINQKDRPADIQGQIVKISNKIIDLRKEINGAKQELYQILFLTY